VTLSCKGCAEAHEGQEGGGDAHLVDGARHLCVDGATSAERVRLVVSRDVVRGRDLKGIAVATNVPRLGGV
jgi:hypothetical protein